jgi:hypothetical protein
MPAAPLRKFLRVVIGASLMRSPVDGKSLLYRWRAGPLGQIEGWEQEFIKPTCTARPQPR